MVVEHGPGRSSMPVELSDERLRSVRRQLLAAIHKSCPSWLVSEVEDIAQSALLRLMGVLGRSGEDLDPNASYIRKVAYSATVDEMRRRFRRKEEVGSEEPDLDGTAAEGPDPERQAASLEIHGGIRQCLSRLPRPRRLAVVCHLQGYSVPEIARLLGWTRKKAEHLTRRGLDVLRQCLVEKGLTP